MNYNFKLAPESVWFVVTAVVTVVLQAVVSTPDAPTDIKAWLVAVGAAAVRALVGALISVATTQKGPTQ